MQQDLTEIKELAANMKRVSRQKIKIKEGFRLTNFFSWPAWAAVTLRPGADHTYTTNWPYDLLVGNVPVPDALVRSIISVVLLILGIAAALFYYVRYIRSDPYESELVIDFPEPAPTPSQKVTLAYFWVAVLLFVIQIGFGAITGHETGKRQRQIGPAGDSHASSCRIFKNIPR